MVCNISAQIWMFFSNFLKLKSLTASKPFQTSSCLNNHKITKTTSSTKRPIKLLTSGDIELNPGPEENLNNHTILSVCSTMLLNLRLRQLGLRPVDVGGECNCFSEQFLISYMVIPIITYSLDKLVFNTLGITLNVLLKQYWKFMEWIYK